MKVMYTRKCLTAGCDASTVFTAFRSDIDSAQPNTGWQSCRSSADLGFNLGLRGDRPATNRSNPVTAGVRSYSETICTVFHEDSLEQNIIIPFHALFRP